VIVTITLNLSPEAEAGLLAQAQASGLTPEEYLLSVVEEVALPARQQANGTGNSAREEAVRRMLEFGEKYHLSFGEPVTRQFLHEGHRF
jgi:hypothetical protein